VKRLRKGQLVSLLVALLLAGLGGTWLWIERSWGQAQKLAAFGLWPDAHTAAARYLWLHPHDASARLLCAEAIVKDDRLPVAQAVAEAETHLRTIPDHAPAGARARAQEAGLELFLLYHPTRAEILLRRAIELQPESPQSYYLYWKLLDLTGRSHLAAPFFWKVYEASAVELRALRLREWYMSQFYPSTANPVLDRLLGIVKTPKYDAGQAEAQRYIRFRNAEPESPLCYAALARWFQLSGDSRFALESLEQGRDKMQNEEHDAFYLATMISLLIEQGEFDRAEECFKNWPEPHTGYEYWLAQGQVLQEVRSQYAEAVHAYDLALRDWPGPADWRTRNRKANCLAQLRDQTGAAREREQAKTIENLMTEKVHRRLRFVLGFLDRPELLQELVDFYQKIAGPREATAWSEHIARVRSKAASGPKAPASAPAPKT
jgi:tetratricopeptide (TPR) repeat protein